MGLQTVRTRAVGAGRLLAGLVGLAVPPVLLAVVVGNPLPSWPVDWDRVLVSVEAGLVPSSVWIHVMAVVAWLAYLALVILLAAEVVAVVRDRPTPAGVPGWMRRVAQLLVSAAVALGSPAQPTAAAGSQLMVAAVAPAAAQTLEGASIPVQPPVQDPAAGRLVTVGEGDSWAGLAADVLGDRELGRRLREANLGRQVGDGHTIAAATAFVEPGWQILVPAQLDRTPATPAPVDTEEPDGVSDVVEVRPGEHFWSIAQEHLADAWERTPSDGEVAGYWTDLVDANRDRLAPPGDPDLIYPGQQFVLPEVPDDPAAGPTATGRAAPALDDDVAASSGTDDAGTMLDGTPSDDAGTVGGSGRPRGLQDGPAAGPQGRLEVDGGARTVWGTPVGLTAGLAGAALSAAGATALLRRRRRAASQQRPDGLRLPTPAPEQQDQLSRIAAAAADDVALESLAALLESLPEGVCPPLVSVDNDGLVRLLWDGPLPDGLPDPWAVHTDEAGRPAAWQAQIGQVGRPSSVGLPLLVTLGRIQAADVTLLANVGGMDRLMVAGPEPQTRQRLRAAALEVATSRMGGLAQVTVVGDQLLGDVDGIELADDVEVAVAAARSERDRDIIPADRTPRLLVCHDHPAAPAEQEGYAGLLGQVTAGTGDPDGWTLQLDSDRADVGLFRLADGGVLELVLPELDPLVVADELARLDDDPVPADPVPADPAADHPAGTDLCDDTVVQMTSTPVAPAWCEVRLLGPVEVVCDGAAIDGLTGQNVELLICLAAHGRDGLTYEQLEDRVWAGQRSKSGRSRVSTALSSLRNRLGDGPDGEPLVPVRDRSNDRIRLSDHVRTDWDRAHGHLEAARGLAAPVRHRELTAAIALVRGPILDGLPLSWATRLEQEMLAPLQDAAVAAAVALREAGEFDRAEWAIRQGLLLCDPHELLYVEWARLECARGRPDQVTRLWHLLGQMYADDADEVAGWAAAPSDATRTAFQQLLAHNS